jgi:acetolactate synthase-1/3 small subunit
MTLSRGPNSNGKLRVLSVVVEDHPGVLARVSGLIRRRGFNIDALSVGPTDRAGRSRMTLTVDAGHAEVDQVGKQLHKLVEVIKVTDLTDEPVTSRELVLVRVGATGQRREAVMQAIEHLGGRTLDIGRDAITVELAADADAIEGFVELLRPYGVKEVARSGPVAMRRNPRR